MKPRHLRRALPCLLLLSLGGATGAGDAPVPRPGAPLRAAHVLAPSHAIGHAAVPASAAAARAVSLARRGSADGGRLALRLAGRGSASLAEDVVRPVSAALVEMARLPPGGRASAPGMEGPPEPPAAAIAPDPSDGTTAIAVPAPRPRPALEAAWLNLPAFAPASALPGAGSAADDLATRLREWDVVAARAPRLAPGLSLGFSRPEEPGRIAALFAGPPRAAVPGQLVMGLSAGRLRLSGGSGIDAGTLLGPSPLADSGPFVAPLALRNPFFAPGLAADGSAATLALGGGRTLAVAGFRAGAGRGMRAGTALRLAAPLSGDLDLFADAGTTWSATGAGGAFGGFDLVWRPGRRLALMLSGHADAAGAAAWSAGLVREGIALDGDRLGVALGGEGGRIPGTAATPLRLQTYYSASLGEGTRLSAGFAVDGPGGSGARTGTALVRLDIAF